MSKRGKPAGTAKAAKGKVEQSSPSPLPGQPGYRTRGGRTGLDPIDSRTEAAHTTGGFIRRLFTGRLIVQNTVLLILLGVIGLVLTLPLVFAVSEWAGGRPLAWDAWILFLIAGIGGIFLLINFIRNMIRRTK